MWADCVSCQCLLEADRLAPGGRTPLLGHVLTSCTPCHSHKHSLSCPNPALPQGNPQKSYTMCQHANTGVKLHIWLLQPPPPAPRATVSPPRPWKAPSPPPAHDSRLPVLCSPVSGQLPWPETCCCSCCCPCLPGLLLLLLPEGWLLLLHRYMQCDVSGGLAGAAAIESVAGGAGAGAQPELGCEAVGVVVAVLLLGRPQTTAPAAAGDAAAAASRWLVVGAAAVAAGRSVCWLQLRARLWVCSTCCRLVGPVVLACWC